MFRRLVMLLLLMAGSLLAITPSGKPTIINKRPYYRLVNISSFYQARYVPTASQVTLRFPDGRNIVFHKKKTEMNLFGVVTHLSFPMEADANGKFCISKIDYDTLLVPILHSNVVPRHTVRRIVVDAGHGGKDHGAERGTILEKNMTLAVARRVSAILRKRGYLVYMTRDTDKQMELSDRTNFANKIKPDLFVAVHINAHSNKNIRGIEVYVPNPAKVPSFLGAMGMTAPCNKFDAENALLGYLMQRRLVHATGAVDRGFKRVQHYVTRNVACPAILVECGFVSNPGECNLLCTPAYMDKLAVAICDTVKEFETAVAPKK